MNDSVVGKKVMHRRTKRVGVVTQELPLGVYVRFPDGNEDLFPHHELVLYTGDENKEDGQD
jgi:hypothetical protein